MKTKILVTGATGFIGSKLCLTLAEMGYQVHALCRDTAHPNLMKHSNIQTFKGDLLNLANLEQAMLGCDEVYHTAALAKMWCKNTHLFYEVNVVGTKHVMDLALKHQVKKVVYTSTCGVWGPTVKYPMTENDPRIGGFPIDYERTKHLAELEVNTYVKKGLNVVTVNPSRVFGEGPITDSNTVSKMITGYLNGKWRVIPGSGENIANYAYLSDVVQGHIKAMQHGETGQRYILGGEDISFNDFFTTVKQISGKHLSMIKVPQPLIKLYSQIESIKTKLTGIAPVFLPAFADRLKYDQKYSSAKAMNQLGYTITPFAEAMQNTITYLQHRQS